MLNESVTMGGLFLEGLLAFFSPCVLPLIPLYLGYLTADIDTDQSKGKIRAKTMLVTLFFILGIGTVFMIAALGAQAFQVFFKKNEIIFQIIGGILLILFGLFSLDIIQLPWLQNEHRLSMPKKGKMSYWNAYLLGFFFSFAWTPCIGPLLGSAIVMSANAATKAMSYMYIASFAVGFLLMFVLVGLFTEEMLTFFKKKQGVVKYTKMIGAIIVLIMGGSMLFKSFQSISARNGSMNTPTQQTTTSNAKDPTKEASGDEKKAVTIDDEDFTLKDAQGNDVTLSSYKGKVVVINFFGTWCPYCMKEMPEIQKIADENDDVQVLLVNIPNNGNEGTIESVEQKMKDKGYSLKILYDEDGSVTQKYGVRGFPHTYFIKKDGTFLGYMPGYIAPDKWNEFLNMARGEDKK